MNYPFLKYFSILLGLFLFLCLLCGPELVPLDLNQQRTLAVVVLMAVWWMTNAFHLSIVALLPLALFPMLSVNPMEEVARNYASSTVFLLMGGFMMAEALKHWGLHQRAALAIISRLGHSPRKTLAGFMLTTAFLSMWISNTAATVMILPMALGVCKEIGKRLSKDTQFAVALTLGIAYSASIGGVATLIGTPPNLILAGLLPKLLPDLPPLSFSNWMLFGVPTAAGLLLFAWGYLAFVVYRNKGEVKMEVEAITQQYKNLGPLSLAEKLLVVVIGCTAIAWLTRPDFHFNNFILHGWQYRLGLWDVDDGTVAMFFALVLCVIPINLKKRVFLLDWDSIQKISWSVILLFGGGFALAHAIQTSGLTELLGMFVGQFKGLPIWLMVLALCLITSFATGVVSNTAIASILLPVLAAASGALDVHPLLLMIPATISASMAFLLPVSTAPNAIAFSSGELKVSDMAKIGVVLNIVGAFWITLMVYLIGKPIFL